MAQFYCTKRLQTMSHPKILIDERLVKAAAQQLAPNGILKAGLNLSNILLINQNPGNPTEASATVYRTTSKTSVSGVAPDFANEIAKVLQVKLELVPFAHPNVLCDAIAGWKKGLSNVKKYLDNGNVVDTRDNITTTPEVSTPTPSSHHPSPWSIGLVGADPLREEFIEFSPAYCEIRACLMVRIEDKKRYRSLSDLDVPGKRIAVKGGAAYDLWLKSNLKHAELVRAKTLDESYNLFVNGIPSDTKEEKHVIDAVAGLRPKLADDVKKEPGKHLILDNNFMSIQQAVGCVRQDSLKHLLVYGSCGKGDKSKNGECEPEFKNPGVEFLNEFVEKAKKVGFVELLIQRHKHMGKLFVAPPASK